MLVCVQYLSCLRRSQNNNLDTQRSSLVLYIHKHQKCVEHELPSLSKTQPVYVKECGKSTSECVICFCQPIKHLPKNKLLPYLCTMSYAKHASQVVAVGLAAKAR